MNSISKRIMLVRDKGRRRAHRRLPYVRFALLSVTLVASSGCFSVLNGWLDPTTLGYFQEGATYEIRTSLGLEDVPSGIPGAVFPNRSDLTFEAVEYPLQGGDQLDIEIYELRERFIPFRMSARVSPTGFVNIPVVGRVDVAGREVAEFEEHLKEILRDRDILKQPQVTIIPTFLQQATYSVFGIGVSAANNAPLRAGTFPILRPDLKILDAINQVGGLNEFVTDVFVFRTDKPDESAQPPAPVDSSQTAPRTPEPMTETDDDGSMESDRPNTPEDLDRAALLDVVDRDDPVDETTAPAQDLPDDLLEPESSDPWIYVDGEFVRNDKYKGPGEDYSRQALVLDAVTPTVNWSKIAGEANYRILRIPAEQLRDGNPEANIYVRAGDVIRVVSGEIGVYYVMGQVNRVGQFAFNSEPVTLKAAIAAAGGLAPLAWPDRCTIYRRLGQREQMIQVNLDRIFAGKEPDFFIRRADIINVGTHPFAPFLQRIRAASLPTITNVLGYGFTYSRNFADIDAFFPQNNPANRPDPIPQLFQ